MEARALKSMADAITSLQDWSDSETFRRMATLAYRDGCRVAVRLDCNSCQEWQEEMEAVFESLKDKLQGDPSLVIFLDGEDIPREGKDGLTFDPKRVRAFALLRPAPLSSVAEGMSTIKPSSQEHYLTCSMNHSVSIGDVAGGELSINLNGLPVMEQDGVASSCAHASLWIATKIATAAFPKCSDSAVITYKSAEEALRSHPQGSDRRLPTAGLAMGEMLTILEVNGYAPLSYAFETDEQIERADQVIYPFIESGIPVILLLHLEDDEGHSVVAAGHEFDRDAWWPGARKSYYPQLAASDYWLSSALWSTEYMIIDDNYGPSLTVTRGGIRNRTSAAIVPLPKQARIFLTPEDAEGLVAATLFEDEFVRTLEVSHSSKPSQWTEWMINALGDRSEQLVLRTFLVEGEKAREHLAGAPGYSEATKAALHGVQFPDFVWLVDVSIPGLYGDKLKLGEVLVDPHMPKAMIRRASDALLWVHVSGVIWAPPSETVDPKLSGPEEPTQLILRPTS